MALNYSQTAASANLNKFFVIFFSVLFGRGGFTSSAWR